MPRLEAFQPCGGSALLARGDGSAVAWSDTGESGTALALLELEGVGHFPMLEAPRAFAEALSRVIARSPQSLLVIA